MAVVRQFDYGAAPDEARAAHDAHLAEQGRMTNMKRTLLHSPPAFKAYMEWYTLAGELEPIIGQRGVHVFSWAISTQNDCLICSTFFRKILKDRGEDPANLRLDAREELLVEYGRLLAKTPHAIPDPVYARLHAEFSEPEILLLTAFAGLMVATNLINTALKVDLDDYLQGY